MNVLIAIDGSDASKKAVSFVGRTLGRSATKDVAVTLFHVVESLPDFVLSRTSSDDAFRQVAHEWFEANRREGETLLVRQKEVLVDAGIPADAVQTKVEIKEGLPEARQVLAALSIIDEMQQGTYDVVCLGRRGGSVSGGSFPGSVAEKVLREARGKAVWVVD